MAVKELSWSRKEKPGIHSRRPHTRTPQSDPPPSSSQSILTSELQSILDALPPVDYAFGYGSGVFTQDSASMSGERGGKEKEELLQEEKPQVDIILAPKCLHSFHKENLELNPAHYSGLSRHLGPSYCANLNSLHPGLYFNPYCSIASSSNPDNHHIVKYGVISHFDLSNDLNNWTSFYTAGRLQKPTLPLLAPSTSLTDALNNNLISAISAGILVSSPPSTSATTVKRVKLHKWISSLSYLGDVRTSLNFEDPRKVEKLTTSKGSDMRFRDLYKAPLEELKEKGLIDFDEKDVTFDVSPRSIMGMIETLPPTLSRLAGREEVKRTLAGIVRGSSLKQTVKGVITAGGGRAIKYGWAKFLKGRKRK